MAEDTVSKSGTSVRVHRVELSPRAIVSVLVAIFAVWLLAQIWQIVLMLAIALILAGTLSPVLEWLEGHRVARPVALTLILLGMVGGILGLAVLVAPALASQAGAFLKTAPATQARIAEVLQRVPALSGEAATVRNATPDALLTPLGKHAVDLVRGVVEVVGLGLATAVLAFYILADRERVQGYVFSLLPRRYHLRVAHVLLDMEHVVGGYVRGQALTSLCIGAFVFVLLLLVGTPNALALAVFAALTDLIPFIGGVLALLPAVLATLPFGLPQAIIVFVGIVLYQQFESHILIPRVYGKVLRLSAVAVTLALLVGGTLLGIVGALLALPIAAGIRVLLEDLRVELPGEQVGERAEVAEEELAERVYVAETEGVPAVDAAAVATTMVEHLQEGAGLDGDAREAPHSLPAPDQQEPVIARPSS